MTISAKQFRQQYGAERFAAYEYIIAVDCGTNTGIAVLHRPLKQLIEVTCVSAHEAWNKVRHMKHCYGSEAIFIRFEDARLRRWFGKAGKEQLQGAGSIKRDSTLWEDFCEMEGIAYEAVAPKDNVTKLNAGQFKARTGWTKQTNEHARDAAGLLLPFL